MTKNVFPQDEQIPEQISTITNNPHAVSEAERLQTMSKNLLNFFSTLLHPNVESKTESDPSSDLLLIEIGTMVKNLIELIETKNIHK